MNIGKFLAIGLIMGMATWMNNGLAKPYMPAPSNAAVVLMPAIPDTMAAFPGAVGDGAYALDMCRDSVREGAWPLKVWRVTSTDSANGSSFVKIARDSLPLYRQAYNIVLILVDGFQQWPTNLETDFTCAYIAGQATQGGGMGHYDRVLVVENVGANRPHDVLFRYITINDNFSSGLHVKTGDRIYIDHTTLRWNARAGGQHNLSVGADSSVDTGYYIREFTGAYVLTYEPQIDHPTNFGFSAAPRDKPAGAQGTTYRYVHAGAGYRAPDIVWDTATVTQSIIYNWRDRATQVTYQTFANLVSMFHHTGPATAVGGGRHMPFHFGDFCRIPFAGPVPDSICLRQVYVAREWYLSTVGNADTLLPSDTRDYWRTTVDGDSIIGCFDASSPGYINAKPRAQSQECPTSTDGEAVPLGWRSSTFIQHNPAWTYPPDTLALDSTLVEAILAEVGNSQRVDCTGAWQSRRDGFDSSRVAWIRNNWLNLGGMQGLTGAQANGIRNASGDGFIVPGNPAGLGGDSISISEYAPTVGAACTDSDADGIPDEFEDLCVGSTTGMSNDGDLSGDGYLNIEEWLNGTNAIRTIAWNDNSTNEDGFEIQRDIGAGWVVLDSVAINVTSYTDSSSWVGYRYRVRAYSGAGQSAFTNIVTSTCN
jgi:hypothetical protein